MPNLTNAMSNLAGGQQPNVRLTTAGTKIAKRLTHAENYPVLKFSANHLNDNKKLENHFQFNRPDDIQSRLHQLLAAAPAARQHETTVSEHDNVIIKMLINLTVAENVAIENMDKYYDNNNIVISLPTNPQLGFPFAWLTEDIKTSYSELNQQGPVKIHLFSHYCTSVNSTGGDTEMMIFPSDIFENEATADVPFTAILAGAKEYTKNNNAHDANLREHQLTSALSVYRLVEFLLRENYSFTYSQTFREKIQQYADLIRLGLNISQHPLVATTTADASH